MEVIEYIENRCKKEAGRTYLTCAAAFEIAEELNIKVSEVGKLCNDNHIKIQHCQIGCF